jgi:serine/threonine protein kinase
VHRYVAARGTAYIVMEYVEGESLQEILDAHGPLPATAWRRWLDPLLDGLAHVHGRGYLHRDLKPANIVIRAVDDEPVLIDFGAARAAARERTHTQVLTPEYAPIEQHGSRGAQGPPTDIYALAAVSYRALTGAPPPSAPDRVLDDLYESLSNQATSPDRVWLAAIDQGLSLRPADRPQTVAAWRTALIQADNKPSETDARVATAAPQSGSVQQAKPVPPQFESFSRLTGRMIEYGGAHAVPIEDSPFGSYNGYVELIEAVYLGGDEGESLEEREESLLMTFYSMYSAMEGGDHGFDKTMDDMLDSLCSDEDEDEETREWRREEEFREILSHLTRGLERCGEDRREALGHVDRIESGLSECQDLRNERTESDDSDADILERICDIEAGMEDVSRHLSASALWFDEWKKNKCALGLFFDCMRQLRCLYGNRLDAAKTRAEREIAEIRKLIETDDDDA